MKHTEVLRNLTDRFKKIKITGKKKNYGEIAVSLICGALAAFILCEAADNFIMARTFDMQLETARSIAGRPPSFANGVQQHGSGQFVEANPFYVAASKKSESGAKSSLSAFQVQGTLPGIGAWIGVNGDIKLVLKNQQVAGYTLADIKYGEVVLSDGKENYTVHLLLSGGASTPPNTASSNSGGKSSNGKIDFSGIEKAGEGVEGVVPREVVDSLLLDPYAELNKLKMRPAADGSGMQLERVDSESVFAQVGVQRDDVIQAVNGVKIANMADAANAVNSMMAGTRFDVTVMRGGKPVELKYQVR